MGSALGIYQLRHVRIMQPCGGLRSPTEPARDTPTHIRTHTHTRAYTHAHASTRALRYPLDLSLCSLCTSLHLASFALTGYEAMRHGYSQGTLPGHLDGRACLSRERRVCAAKRRSRVLTGYSRGTPGVL